MEVCTSFPLVDEVIGSYFQTMGPDAAGYRNHIYRVLNYFAALAGDDSVISDAVLIAASFHDIGIWTDRTFNYLAPSIHEAGRYLCSHHLDALTPQVSAVINEHHKLHAYTGNFREPVETFRRADLVDVSYGAIRFGLPLAFIRSVNNAFPGEGFHRLLVRLAARQLVRHPFDPLPMIKW